MATIRVVLADDHLHVRAGLRSLLQGQAGIEIVGEAADGAEALAVAARQQADVILMDLSMPGVGGLQALQQLQDLHWRPAVIILTMHDGLDYVREAMARGARGYLLKTSPIRELIGAIQAVARGETHITGTLAARLAASLHPAKTSRAEPAK